jgi:hypothetical protein
MCEVRYITSNEYTKRLKLNILIVDDDEKILYNHLEPFDI